MQVAMEATPFQGCQAWREQEGLEASWLAQVRLHSSRAGLSCTCRCLKALCWPLLKGVPSGLEAYALSHPCLHFDDFHLSDQAHAACLTLLGGSRYCWQWRQGRIGGLLAEWQRCTGRFRRQRWPPGWQRDWRLRREWRCRWEQLI